MLFSSIAFLALSINSLISVFSLSVTLSPKSLIAFSAVNIICSVSFLTSASSFLLASASLFASASFIILSISSSVRLVLEVIVIFCSLFVPKSFALTLTIPLASISNDTSICGTPLGAGGISESWNLPRVLLSAAIGLSPCKIWISTAGWLSTAVLNTWLFVVGIVVFLGINTVITLPSVSIPKLSGVTSSSTKSSTSPVKTPPWIAAPIATTSSGLTSLLGSLPVSRLTSSCTHGIRVDPPTSNTLSKSLELRLASFKASFTCLVVLSTKSLIKSSNLALVNVTSKCSGPLVPCVINGKLILVVTALLKSFLAFSEASFNLWRASLSVLKSIPFCFLNSSTK